MNRIEMLRKLIDQILHKNIDLENKRCSFVHLYSVSAFCNMIALKRNLDPEIALAIGMLHDISSYITNDPTDHSKYGKIESEKILKESTLFSLKEINIITQAIYNHSDKQNVHNQYDELIKDADVLQHYLYNSTLPTIEHEKNRLKILRNEFGF
jgi:uncharacterized protein